MEFLPEYPIYLICSKLTKLDLYSTSIVCSSFYRIVHSEYFFKSKTVPLFRKHKPEYISWRNWLKITHNCEDIIKGGYLEILKFYLPNYDKRQIYSILTMACMYGKLSIVKYIYKKYELVTRPRIKYNLCGDIEDHIEFSKWLFSKYPLAGRGYLCSAIRNGLSEILEIAIQNKVRPISLIHDAIINFGSLADIQLWLEYSEYPVHYHQNHFLTNRAENDQLDIVKWLNEKCGLKPLSPEAMIRQKNFSVNGQFLIKDIL